MGKVSCDEITLSLDNSTQVSLASNTQFIKLKEPKKTFAEIDGIQVYNDTIYVFDKVARNILMSFDKEGNHLVTFGERGNSKNEYSRLWAFDVDKDYVYLYDRAKKCMMYFSHDGKFIKASNTDFRGDSFKALSNGKFLFSFALDEKLYKLGVVDNLLKIEKLYLNFNKEDKDNLSNNNVFQRVDDQIFYNKEMSDTIYAFSDEGELEKSYYINFSGKNVPQEYKFDFEKLMDDGKEKAYAYLNDCPMICNSVLIVPTAIKGKYGFVYYNLKDKKEEKQEGVTNLLCVSKDMLYGWMDMDSYQHLGNKTHIPANVVDFMRNGGRVLLCSPSR